ncbi:MAG: hypothetical protein U9N87_07255, partial [Planctomycetota bacterium]|nr:hypothetical protein [Planctomycetota bacterium]
MGQRQDVFQHQTIATATATATKGAKQPAIRQTDAAYRRQIQSTSPDRAWPDERATFTIANQARGPPLCRISHNEREIASTLGSKSTHAQA